MGFQLPITIAQAMRDIQARDLVLPAIQREFVWDDMQIARLFDSLLRGYPIGSLLVWKITPETAKEFRFYGFLKDFHEKENPHCPVLDIPFERDVRAVLDGQQRLTALNIGLRGTFAAKLKHKWWNSPDAFPVKQLCINVFAEASENEFGMKYDFRMLAEKDQGAKGDAYWLPVQTLYSMASLADLMAMVADREIGNHKMASKMLGDLYGVIHQTPLLYVYEEEDQDIEKVLDIFIRVNSGGTTLSYSDLLLSIATAQWDELDARDAIYKLIDELNEYGFRFSKDVVLKAALVLIGVADVGFKVRNFNRANMAALQEQWGSVRASLQVASGLLSDFGLTDATLTANSVLVPVAYYVHRRALDQSYRTASKHAADRQDLKTWTSRSLAKQGVWGSGLDTLLRDLRSVIDQHGEQRFPVDPIYSAMAARGKALTFSPEEVEELLDLRYGQGRTFAVLAMLFPHVDARNIHHVDHVFPRSLLDAKASGLERAEAQEVENLRDGLPNLQLLEGSVNISKSDIPPALWAEQTYPGAALDAYLDRNALPPLPAKSAEFTEWYWLRREVLRGRLEQVLGLASGSAGQL